MSNVNYYSGEEYEPSQVISDSDDHQQQRLERTTRKASGRAMERISHAYDAGEILDSQTSDSQFIRAAESIDDIDSLSNHALADCTDDHADSDGGTPRSYDDTSSTADTSETDHVRRLEGDLRRAHAQIEFLRSQVEDLEEVGMIQHRRIGELQARILDDAFILDPNEQSQILIPASTSSASTSNNATGGTHHRASATRSRATIDADGTRNKKRKLRAAA